MDYVHHVIPKHEWKRRFGNLIGVNAPDNLVVLTLEQHIEIHKRYGEEGSGGDQAAYLLMTKAVGAEEIFRQLNVEAHKGTTYNRGRKHSEEHNRAKSEWSKGNKRALGHKCSEQTKLIMSQKRIQYYKNLKNSTCVSADKRVL